MSITRFLYRYVFRGLGWLLAVGVITGLILWVTQATQPATPSPSTERRVPR